MNAMLRKTTVKLLVAWLKYRALLYFPYLHRHCPVCGSQFGPRAPYSLQSQALHLPEKGFPQKPDRQRSHFQPAVLPKHCGAEWIKFQCILCSSQRSFSRKLKWDSNMFQRTGYTFLEAFPGTVVTPVGRVGVGVAAAVAGLTGIAHLQRVAVVTVGTSGNFGRDKKKRT